MVERIRPVLLARKPIRLNFFEKEDFDAPACVQKDGEKHNTIFQINVYRKVARKLFEKTPLYRLVPYQVFENALVLHEIAHVNAGTMDEIPLLAGNGVYDVIENILDDTHDEHLFCYQYPTYSRYIELALSVLKYKSPAPEDSNLGVDLAVLYKMVRFGVVPEQADEKWVSTILAVMYSAIRGSHGNCVHAAQALYWFLYEKNNGDDASQQDKNTWVAASASNGHQQTALSKQDVEDMQADGSLQLSGSAHKDTLESLVKDAAALKKSGKNPSPYTGTGQQPDTGHYAGLSSDPLQLETDDEFYRNTVLQFAGTIADMRRAFLVKLEYPDWKASYEGEFNLQRQEQAYIDSHTYEESPTYLTPRPSYPDMRALVLTDVSGSTNGIQTEYAQAKVVFLASLDDIPGVFTAQIDFNTDVYVNKRFEDSLPECAMHPYASGGTCLDDTIEELQQFDLSSSRDKVCFVITDGAIGNWPEAESWFLAQEQETGMITWVIEVVASYKDAHNSYSEYGAKSYKNFFYSTVEDLAQAMAGKVLPLMGV